MLLFLDIDPRPDYLFHMKGGLDSTLNGSVSRAQRKSKFLYLQILSPLPADRGAHMGWDLEDYYASRRRKS